MYMNEFEWTYDIIANPIHVGAEFRIDKNSNMFDSLMEPWVDGRFIHFKLTYVDFDLIRLLVLDANDTKVKMGDKRQMRYEEALDLIKKGYWQQL